MASTIFARRALSAQAARAVSAQATGAKLGLEGLAGKVPRGRVAPSLKKRGWCEP